MRKTTMTLQPAKKEKGLKDRHCDYDPTSWQTERARRRSPLALRDMTTSGRWQGTVDGE